MSAPNPLEQIRHLSTKAEKILIVTHRKPDGDGIGSSLALFRVFQKMNKQVTLACADEIPETYHFLPEVKKFVQDISGGRDLIITLDCSQAEVGKLKYNLEGNKMNIILTPKKGSLTAQNVRFSQSSSDYDLIFIVDVADPPQLGEIYSNNVDLFYNIPTINIDHHISNTEFGKVNYINPAASSTAEIMPKIIHTINTDKNLIDADIATDLLTGIITDTGSFQNPNTSPLSFDIAAELLEAGGRQQEIIRKIYKTKELSTLKLWGKILSKIKHDAPHKIVWSTISETDFNECSAKPEDSGGIIDELLGNAPDAEVVLLLKEHAGIISASLRTTSPSIDATHIAKLFGGGGHVQAAGFKIESTDLFGTEQKIINTIRKFQAERLGQTATQTKISQSAPAPQKIAQEIVFPDHKPITQTSSTPNTPPPPNTLPTKPALSTTNLNPQKTQPSITESVREVAKRVQNNKPE